MRHAEISDDLRALTFDFFYWFSRFEFALKENGFLRNKAPGSRAEAGWDCFVREYEGQYSPTAAGLSLIYKNPRRQMVGANELEFHDVAFDNQTSELGKVIGLLKTVRNNLFHGGKHGADGWDDPLRTQALLTLSISILDELAEVGGIEADYRQYY